MSHAYTPTPTALPGTVTIPDDGDLPVAADTGGPDEIILDALKNVEQYVILSGDVDRVQITSEADPSEWSYAASGNRAQQNEEPGGLSLRIPCSLPHGSTWSEGSVTISPVVVARAGLPSVMPSVGCFKKNVTTGTVTGLGSTYTDASATVGAYESVHTLTNASFSEVVNSQQYTYYMLLSGEGDGGGGNYQQGLEYIGAITTHSATHIDSGAS